MTGRTWRRRSLGRGDHEIVVSDGRGQKVAMLVSLSGFVEHQPDLMDKITALVAGHHGDAVDDPHTRGSAA